MEKLNTNKEKALLWIGLIFGASLFVGAIVAGIKHSVKHGATKPTRTEFNLLVDQVSAWQEKRDSQFIEVLKKSEKIIDYEIKQDSIISVLRADLDRIIKGGQNSK